MYEITREIVTREGGYVNDPDGVTNFGVTIHTIRRIGLDLDNNGKITSRDVRKLTAEQAVQIFVDHYFIKPKINALPAILQVSVFDMYVNAGGNAVKILQRLLIQVGQDVDVDGTLCPHSICAAHAAFEIAPRLLVDAYGIERRNYYYKLADRRKASCKYPLKRGGGKGGWIKRAEEFISQKISFHAIRTCRKGEIMGLIKELLGLGRSVGHVAEVFVQNKTKAQTQAHLRAVGAQAQFAAEFQHARSGFFIASLMR